MIQEPIQPTSPADPAGRGAGRSRRDALLVVGLVIALLVAASVAVAFAARGGDPDRSLAAGASAAPAASAAPDRKDDGQGAKKGPKPGKGSAIQGGPGRGPISITAIDGNRLSLATEDGWTRTITATSATVITKGGQAIAVAALKVGDEIRFRQVRNADGSYTITTITVPTPQRAGEVTAVGATTITIKGRRDATQVVTVTGSTVYKLGSAPASKADVTVGSEIAAAGTIQGDTFTAITVWIERPHVDGDVTAKTANTITVKRKDGSTATIHVSSTTTYAIKGDAAASLADIAVGNRVTGVGTLRADGSLDAMTVHAKPAKAAKPSTTRPKASVAPSG